MNTYLAVKVLFMKNADGCRENVIVISLKEADFQNNEYWLDPRFSTWGMQRHFKGYVKLRKKYCLMIKRRTRFRVSHRRLGRKGIRLTGQNHINNL
jgi:hypothetical protein